MGKLDTHGNKRLLGKIVAYRTALDEPSAPPTANPPLDHQHTLDDASHVRRKAVCRLCLIVARPSHGFPFPSLNDPLVVVLPLE